MAAWENLDVDSGVHKNRPIITGRVHLGLVRGQGPEKDGYGGETILTAVVVDGNADAKSTEADVMAMAARENTQYFHVNINRGKRASWATSRASAEEALARNYER